MFFLSPPAGALAGTKACNTHLASCCVNESDTTVRIQGWALGVLGTNRRAGNANAAPIIYDLTILIEGIPGLGKAISAICGSSRLVASLEIRLRCILIFC